MRPGVVASLADALTAVRPRRELAQARSYLRLPTADERVEQMLALYASL